MTDCGHPLHKVRGPVCECGLWKAEDDEGLAITENYGIMSDTQVPEVRYVSSSDAASSGDGIS